MHKWKDLRSVPIPTIEEIIGRALSDVTEREYDCHISQITFNDLREGAAFDVTVSEREVFPRRKGG